MFPDCILLMSSQSTNLMNPVSPLSVHYCFLSVLPFAVMMVGFSTTVPRPVMFTLLLVILLAIISWMQSVLSVFSVSSWSCSGIL